MYALQSRIASFAKVKGYWTGQDYSHDPKKILTFATDEAVDRWLRTHHHLRKFLVAVEIRILNGTEVANADQA